MVNNPFSKICSEGPQDSQRQWQTIAAIYAAGVGMIWGKAVALYSIIALVELSELLVERGVSWAPSFDARIAAFAVVGAICAGMVLGAALAALIGWKCAARLCAVREWTVFRTALLGAVLGGPFAVGFLVFCREPHWMVRVLAGVVSMAVGAVLATRYYHVFATRHAATAREETTENQSSS